MEKPYPESDAQMIKNNSIDNGRVSDVQIETAANLLLDQDVLNDEPLAAGPDLASGGGFAGHTNEAFLQAPFGGFIERARGLYEEFPRRGQNFVRDLETRAKQNPWLAIAAAGAGALAVGLVLGRLFKNDYTNEEYPSGYEE